ncbi:MAG TPA: VTT domain-containing protein [Silvibacterium sp.]|nr:VTT domain-containing protein [Silvibacterium sp.]
MKFFRPLLYFLFHIGYFGPLLMGILDSSFLVLPFGNDLVVVGLVAQHHKGAWLYVLAAACGSTIGALLLALVARKLGEEGIRKLAGQKKYDKLKKRIGSHSGFAVALGGLAPPPFPFTMVIAAAAALDYSLWRILGINFLARAARFTLLAWLAIKFGQEVIAIAKSDAFRWSMGVFIFLCLAGSAFSIWQWWHKSRSKEK